MSQWNDPELQKLFLEETPLIDVRAPIEFSEGIIPFSVNLPIMNNDERAKVGTEYKLHGQDAAIKLGHELVSGEIKAERISAWKNYLERHPKAEVFCFRGGLRSQTSCDWIKQAGIEKKPIKGGYKRMRNFFLSWLNEAPLPNLIRVAGPTGSGKSQFIQSFTHIDLEELAHHRGSAFGERGVQPAQITFENQLALDILKLKDKKIVIEDESATIGKIILPRRFFLHLRSSPMVVVEVEREERVKNIFEGYVRDHDLSFFLKGLEKIKNSLGGLRYQEIKLQMEQAFVQELTLSNHSGWITGLLQNYYDPTYLAAIERQKNLVLFKGSREQVRDYLSKNN